MHGRNNQLRERTAPVKASRSQATGTGQGDLSLANQCDPYMQMKIHRKKSNIDDNQRERVDYLNQRHDLFPIFKNERWQPLMIHSASLRTRDKLEAMSHDKQPGSKSVKDADQTEILAAILQHASWLTYQQLAILQVNYLMKLSIDQNLGSHPTRR